MFWASQSLNPKKMVLYASPKKSIWNFQSIDTMKYSRDLAFEKLEDTSFDVVIEQQIGAIAETGATHVALATPYDEAFVPFLNRWVASARAHHLKIWFRGNFSGWEGWFNYPKISREEHLKKTEAFLSKHNDLFEDGDVFSSCPECENGGPGDPRQTGDVTGHRRFLIAEYTVMKQAFERANKNVRVNFFSMNGDVAKLVMDKETTRALGGIVTIDHYVKTPEQLAKDIEAIAVQSGGRVILGEFGAPIPDIHGSFTEAQQRDWISRTLSLLQNISALEGLNYWLAVGGSTEIWHTSGQANAAVEALKRFYHSRIFYGRVYDDIGRSIAAAQIQIRDRRTTTNEDGYFELPVPDYETGDMLTVNKQGYGQQILSLRGGNIPKVILVKANKNFIETLSAFSQTMFGKNR